MSKTNHSDEGIALCLAGGGYEAMLFHIGCLWRLNDSGVLPRIHRVSCVSGGAFVGGVLARTWNAFGFDRGGCARHFEQQLVTPIRRLVGETIDEWCILGGAFSAVSGTDILADALDHHLYERYTLGDIPEERPGVPSFIFSACNMRSGALFSFSRSRVWDRRLGEFRATNLRVALVVTAASAFVPMLSPVTVTFDASTVAVREEGNTAASRYTAALTNGAVLDPLALEPVWTRSRHVLVCDGGGSVPDAFPKDECYQHTADVLTLMHRQARDAQRAQLHKSMRARAVDGAARNVAYCGMEDALGNESPGEAGPRSANSSRLFAIPAGRQEHLINLGYAACDRTCRQWLPPQTERAGQPYAIVAPSQLPVLS